MADTPQVRIKPNGPYLLMEGCTLVHPDGTEELKEGTVALCRCGASANKPFCDGAHKPAGFQG